MSYTLTLDPFVDISAPSVEEVVEAACDQARRGCMPPYVFSIEGQVHFREALHHLSDCRRRSCTGLRHAVCDSMQEKLRWLFTEEVLLGCVQIQPYLYGARRVIFERQHFSGAAHHLARCPHESCAQLRRALLLRVRDQLRPT